MSWLTKIVRPKIRNLIRKDTPNNLWHRCPGCGELLFYKDVEDNFYVCSLCEYHMYIPLVFRLSHLLDEGSYEKLALPQKSRDILNFKDRKPYKDRLKEAQQKTKEEDAVALVRGHLDGHSVILSVFDFNFIGGSMGMAVGEAIIHGAQLACQEKRSYIIISSSGGARMQEGIFSLMQMPRSVLGTLMMEEKGIPFITVLAHPTTGGVAASFAFLGDVVLAEPGAIIGFTGGRIIQEITGEKLPENFQSSEFQYDHGMIDDVVSRSQLKNRIGTLLTHLYPY